MVKLTLVGEPHEHLLSSDNLLNDFSGAKTIIGSVMEGLYVQGFEGAGRIAEHDHGDEELTEIIHLSLGSHYNGLSDPAILSVGKSHIVKPQDGVYIPHGGQASYQSIGQWLSLKICDQAAEHVRSETLENNLEARHVFKTQDGIRSFIITTTLDNLEQVDSCPIVLFALPQATLQDGQEYNSICGSTIDFMRDDPVAANAGRYLAYSRKKV